MRKSFASGLHEEWSEPVDECIGLLSPIEAGPVNTSRLNTNDLTAR